MYKDQAVLDNVSSVGDSEPFDIFFFAPEGGRQRLDNFEPVYDEELNLLNLSDLPMVHLALLLDTP